MSSSAKCRFLFVYFLFVFVFCFLVGLYYVFAGTARYLAYVFICLFLDHTQNSHNYKHGRCFKMSHFFKISTSKSFYLLILLYSLMDTLRSVGTSQSIRKHVFLSYSLTSLSGLLPYVIIIMRDFHTSVS